MRDTGRCSFNALDLQFYAFDILLHRGRSCLLLPLEERRGLLTDALRKVKYPVLRSTSFDAKPADLIRAAKELELEGIMAKRKASMYLPGKRSDAWLSSRFSAHRVRHRRLHGCD